VPEVLAVAAARASTPTVTEFFSSQGPNQIFFPAPATRNKPDVTGIDGVSTSRPGFSPFFGTSAAPPSVAGVAAPLLQRSPGLTPAQARTTLQNTAVNLGAAGFDFDSGFGRVDALNAVPVIALSIDTPPPGAALVEPFLVGGWAIDGAAPTGTGVDAVHVYAVPSGGSPIFLGAAIYGGARPDIGSLFGSRFTNSGYSLIVTGLAAGAYQLQVFAHSAATGTFSNMRTVSATVLAGGRISVDTPGAGASLPAGQSFLVAGWAIDVNAPTGTGVDAVHVYAIPAAGSPVFLGI